MSISGMPVSSNETDRFILSVVSKLQSPSVLENTSCIGMSKIKLQVIGTFTGSIYLKTNDFNGDSSTYTTVETITSASELDYTLAATEEYYAVETSEDFSSEDGVNVYITAVKKSDSGNVVIDSVANIPTYNIGCITVLTPELEAQGGSSQVSMCWDNTLNKYKPTSKVVFYKDDIAHTITADEVINRVTIATFNIPAELVFDGFTLKGLVVKESTSSIFNTRILSNNNAVLFKDTRFPTTSTGLDIMCNNHMAANRGILSNLTGVSSDGIYYYSGVYPSSGSIASSITLEVSAEMDISYTGLELSINY